jgi:hypothetical protein
MPCILVAEKIKEREVKRQRHTTTATRTGLNACALVLVDTHGAKALQLCRRHAQNICDGGGRVGVLLLPHLFWIAAGLQTHVCTELCQRSGTLADKGLDALHKVVCGHVLAVAAEKGKHRRHKQPFKRTQDLSVSGEGMWLAARVQTICMHAFRARTKITLLNL